MADDALALAAIHAFYGDSHVLQDVSLRLAAGRVLGLLGRNGAGKTTCMNVAVGLLPPRAGTVTLFGERVSGRAPEAIAARGLALVPQGRRIFRSLSVRENLTVVARKPAAGARHPWTLEAVFAAFPRLAERQRQPAGHLSGGEQQMLAIGRALMANPRVLLMDEPSEGLAPQIVAEVMSTIRKLKEQGLSILLVE
ncbi:MAG TPA: ABC transporter ATP-binding protein, partial [Stellaceae bacterium]|nr:ABC transporter ATP-binding protein [Stellaceae bacterium]